MFCCKKLTRTQQKPTQYTITLSQLRIATLESYKDVQECISNLIQEKSSKSPPTQIVFGDLQ